MCSLCGKVSALLSDPALDTSPTTETDPLVLSKQALDAATMADSIAQLGMRPAKTPHSPHVHGNHTISGDLPSAGLGLKASSFAAELDVGPFSVQEGGYFWCILECFAYTYCLSKRFVLWPIAGEN